MEAELGEMDAEGRSERPPYAPGKKKKKRRAKLRAREATLWEDWSAWAHFPTSQVTLGTLVVSWLKC